MSFVLDAVAIGTLGRWAILIAVGYFLAVLVMAWRRRYRRARHVPRWMYVLPGLWAASFAGIVVALLVDGAETALGWTRSVSLWIIAAFIFTTGVLLERRT